MSWLWTDRRVRALVVAGVVALWPACNSNTAPPTGGNRVNLDFTLADAAGKQVRLSDFEGKPLLINFWATWCGPCKLEIPWFVELTEQYKDHGFTVIGVSTDDTAEQIQEFAAKYHVNYPMLVGKGQDELMHAFGAETFIPVSILIRPDGTMQARADGARERDWFESEIEAMF